MESPKNSIKRRKKIRLFRRFFTPLFTKNYSFSIKMSTRIKRLSFAILYCKAKSKNEEFRKKSLLNLRFSVMSNPDFSQLILIGPN